MKVINPNTLASPDGSFTRSSSGTYTDNTGLIKTVGNNIPRFDYDFTNSLPKGVLIENSSQNLFQYTEDISNAFWTKINSAINANTGVAPDGTTTADLFRENTSNGLHEITASYSVTNSLIYSQSFFVKASGRSIVGLSEVGVTWGSSSIVYFDLNTGLVNDSGTGLFTIEKLANSWFRISKRNTAAGTGTGTFKLILATGTLDSPVTVYTGNNTSGVLVWGCQLELNNKTSYIANSSNTLNTRAADAISGPGLIYSSAIETVSSWNSGTTYALNTRVLYVNKIWESLQASNINHVPDELKSNWWVEVSPDNKHSMFDKQVNTVTSAITELNVIVMPGLMDALSLINVEADYVYVTVRDGPGANANIISQFDAGLSGSVVSDWYEYFFTDPLIKRTQLVFSGIAPFQNCVISLEFKIATGKTTSVSTAVFGSLTDLGLTQFGASAGIIDYSVKNTDDFGNVTFVERPYSKRLNAQVMMQNSKLNRNYNLLTRLRAVPCVWVGSSNSIFEEPTVIYGFYKDFSIDIAYPSHSICSIEIEGLT